MWFEAVVKPLTKMQFSSYVALKSAYEGLKNFQINAIGSGKANLPLYEVFEQVMWPLEFQRMLGQLNTKIQRSTIFSPLHGMEMRQHENSKQMHLE